MFMLTFKNALKRNLEIWTPLDTVKRKKWQLWDINKNNYSFFQKTPSREQSGYAHNKTDLSCSDFLDDY